MEKDLISTHFFLLFANFHGQSSNSLKHKNGNYSTALSPITATIG